MRETTKRISTTPEAWGRFGEFCGGLGAEYSESLLYMIDALKQDASSDNEAGYRLRADLDAWRKAREEKN